MSEHKDEKTITMTEEQLERIIRSAVRSALRDVKAEDELPGNEVDEREAAPASFSLLEMLATGILSVVILFCVLIVCACVKLFIDNGFSLLTLIMLFDFVIIGVMSFFAIRELKKTKKIEVLSTIFSAIMAFSSLTVAVVSAYFAYLSIGGGAA